MGSGSYPRMDMDRRVGVGSEGRGGRMLWVWLLGNMQALIRASHVFRPPI